MTLRSKLYLLSVPLAVLLHLAIAFSGVAYELLAYAAAGFVLLLFLAVVTIMARELPKESAYK